MTKALQNQIEYWHSSSKEDWKTAEYLLEGKRYDACLFFCHLSIEKFLKGLVVIETRETPPFIHHLLRLTQLANIECPADKKDALQLITTFHIAGRYKTEKSEFYRKCTKPYTEKHFVLCKEILVWLKKESKKKSSKK